MSVPSIVNVVPPVEGVTVAPPAALADRIGPPSTAVKVSPAIVGVSERLSPTITAGWPMPIVAVAGAAMDGVPVYG